VHRGEIHWLDWSPGRGSEQAGIRPALVIQEDAASANPAYPVTIVAAVSTKGRDVPQHVRLEPTAETGLTRPSYVKCEQVQTVAKERFRGLIGRISDDDLARVGTALRKVLALE